MGEKLSAGLRNGSGDQEAARLRQEIAHIRDNLSREIAELDRRRVAAVAKARKYAVVAGVAGLGTGALITTALVIGNKFLSKREA